MYYGGKIVAKCNICVEGLSEEELVVVKATWGDNEHPIAPLPPPDASLHDPTAVVLNRPTVPVTLSSATCPACVLEHDRLPVNKFHSGTRGGVHKPMLHHHQCQIFFRRMKRLTLRQKT